MQSAFHQDEPDFAESVYDAADSGRISVDQEYLIMATDAILHAQRGRERTPIWIAVEVAGRVGTDDIHRSRESAEALGAVFGEAAVAGGRVSDRRSCPHPGRRRGSFLPESPQPA